MKTLRVSFTGAAQLCLRWQRYIPEEERHETVGRITVWHEHPLQAELVVQHIWVKPGYRRLGLGKLMLADAVLRFPCARRVRAHILNRKSLSAFTHLLGEPVRGSAQLALLRWRGTAGLRPLVTFRRPRSLRRTYLALLRQVDLRIGALFTSRRAA